MLCGESCDSMKSINFSKKRKQTPPWLLKQFKRSFESLYATNKKSKLSNAESKSSSYPSIPEMIYLPPREQINSPSAAVPKNVSSNTKNPNFNSSFKVSASKSASNGNLSNYYSHNKTPEKYFSPLNSNWKAVDTVAKVKRGRSVVNLRMKDSPSTERPCEFDENLDYDENFKIKEKRKFSKKFLKSKLAKLFKSSNKLIQEPFITNNKHDRNSFDGDKGTDVPTEQPNDALRNLSFTAAMMAKEAKQIKTDHPKILECQTEVLYRVKEKKENKFKPPGNLQKTEDPVKQIPSSTLRFWRKPSEEKIKASHRRTQDNIYGSSEVLLKINPPTDAAKISSELSLFSDETNIEVSCDFGRLCNIEAKNSVSVAGYDKAFQRYQNIVRQSQHLSRKDRTLSMACDSDNNNQHTNFKMRNCQSSGSVNTLTRSTSVVNSNNDDLFRKSRQSDSSRNYYSQKMCTNKRYLVTNPHGKFYVPSKSPPAYDKSLGNNRRSRQKVIPPSTQSFYQKNCHGKLPVTNPTTRHIPKPPPRSDSLIRSFELICQNLKTSISEPRGDSFKIFKNQNDYQAWLRNLPYHNPDKISTMLRLRSKVSRRQCVSELFDIEIADFGLNKKRHYSWPLLKRTAFSVEDNYNKRSNSLSRVKNKIPNIDEMKVNHDSPSLCNYSRLYCLKNSVGIKNEKLSQNTTYHRDSIAKPRPAMLNIKSTGFNIQNRRSAKNRQKQENPVTSRMTESCHETVSNCVI